MGMCICGNPTPASRGTKPTKWCSQSCRVGSYHAAAKAAAPPFSRVYFGRCQECDTAWSSRSSATKYCSLGCRDRRLSRRRLETGTSRRYVETRRVRLRDAESETIERLIVAERDSWECGICRGRIDPQLAYPDRRSLSIDHIVPLVRGGAHLYVNVRATHWECNVLRGARIGDIAEDTDKRMTHV